MQTKILVDVPLPDRITSLLEDYQLHIWSEDEPNDETLATFDGIVTYGHPLVDGGLMDKMTNLKVISNFGVGVDHINLADAEQRGIPVGNTPNMLDGATADMTFALLMAAARNIIVGDHYARSPEFTSYDPSILLGQEVHESTLGIIGMGNIGLQVARRAQGFDMTVLYHNRNRKPEAEKDLGVQYAALDELLKRSDFVALNVPLTSETREMIGRDQLKMMKSTAILINLARGGVIDHDALVEALENKWIAVAALDVTEPEPLPRDHPLLTMDNVVLAPHLGSATFRTRQKMAERTVANLKAGLAGEPLITPAY
ncbi:MAG: D-glycerate dehydrogenase [Chloroflexota bacterium]